MARLSRQVCTSSALTWILLRISPLVLIAYVVLVALSLGGLVQSHGMPEFFGQRFIGLTAHQLLERMGSCTEIVVLAVQCMPNDAQHFRAAAGTARRRRAFLLFARLVPGQIQCRYVIRAARCDCCCCGCCVNRHRWGCKSIFQTFRLLRLLWLLSMLHRAELKRSSGRGQTSWHAASCRKNHHHRRRSRSISIAERVLNGALYYFIGSIRANATCVRRDKSTLHLGFWFSARLRRLPCKQTNKHEDEQVQQ